MKPDFDTITITLGREDKGTIVADKVQLETLVEYLRDHGIKLLNSQDAPSGLSSIDFTCPEHQLRDTVREWEERHSHNIEYKSAFAS